MWKHKNFINLQLYGFVPTKTIYVYVNGTRITLTTSNEIWADSQEYNTNFYSISGNTVVWQDGKILQYNGVDVLPTDTIVYDGQYTTRSATPTLTFKHFFDAGTIGSGTVKFRHYSQQEPSSGETWVLNETIPITSQGSGGYNANFVSNGTTYTYINFDGKPNGIRYSNSTDEILAYSWVDNAWTNQVYRTLTFATPPTGDLLAWLQANGTKQGGATLINFTINGTAYQAEEGMTWEQWCNSSYNTDGYYVREDGVITNNVYFVSTTAGHVSSTDTIVSDYSYAGSGAGGGGIR